MPCRRISWTLFPVFALLASGCSGGSEDDGASDESENAVIGGTVTWDQPAIGWINWYNRTDTKHPGTACTATLVSPRVILTAAHCVAWLTNEQQSGDYGTFEIQKKNETHVYHVQRYHGFSDWGGPNDVGLAQLKEVVPATVAAPLRLGVHTPPNGTLLTFFGFGCTSDNGGGGTAWTKRKRTHKQGETIHELCPGDSGGPLLWGDAVYEMGSYVMTTIDPVTNKPIAAEDFYANVPANRAELQAQIDGWRNGGPTGPMGPEGSYSGTLAATPSVQFGGLPYCTYSQTFRNVGVEMTVSSTGNIAALTVTDVGAEAIINPDCPFQALPPISQTWELVATSTSPGTHFDLTPTIDINNPQPPGPPTDLTADVVAQGSGLFQVNLTWKRTDPSTGPLTWTVTGTVSAARK
jgi:V8-like Glu-specific endopeptidase